MKYLILGAAGFIGKNLIEDISGETGAELLLFDREEDVYPVKNGSAYRTVRGDFETDTDFFELTRGIDVVYHLISTTLPNSSNENLAADFSDNVVSTIRLLDACVKNQVKKVMFISSGGTVYGAEATEPVSESSVTNPISAYGLQKITIEKLLYLYRHLFELEYRVVRLSNPYGKYKKPNGVQGVVNTFVYKALRGEPLCVYGDGSVVRDYIAIGDAVTAVRNIEKYAGEHRVFNVGSGVGHSVNDVIEIIEKVLKEKVNVSYSAGRKADVPVNILDVSRYEECFGKAASVSLERGIAQLVAEYSVQKG